MLCHRDSPLSYLINMWDAISRLTSLNSTSSLSIVVSEGALRILLYTTVEGFTSSAWRRLLQNLENLLSLVVPLPFVLLPMQVVILSSSNFKMMCPRLRRISITTDIPADQVYDEQLRRVDESVEATRCHIFRETRMSYPC